ncbi:MAG: GNAT family N-acetyltransferase [Candidatus Hodarchaeota archaeon]
MVLIEIAHGIPENQKLRVAEIIFDAFEDKYKHIFGPRKRSIYALVQFLREDRTIVALQKGTVIGVGGLKFGRKGFIDPNLSTIVRILKLGTPRAVIMGWFFYLARVEENELFIDSLAVAKDMRSKGVGSSMINSIVDFARSKGYLRVKLWVMEKNWRAKKLYKKKGFKEGKTHSIPFPWDRIFGFRKVYEMTLQIT